MPGGLGNFVGDIEEELLLQGLAQLRTEVARDQLAAGTGDGTMPSPVPTIGSAGGDARLTCG